MSRSTRSLITTTVLIVALYLAIGTIVGVAAYFAFAGEDLNGRQQCDSWRACKDQNAFVLASALIIWPVYLVADPLLALALVVAVSAAFALGRRRPHLRA